MRTKAFIQLSVLWAALLSGVEADATFRGSNGRLAFVATPAKGSGDTFGLFTAPSDGSSLLRLTVARREADPSWSPDGRRIAFLHTPKPRRGPRVYVIGRNGSNRIRISGPSRGRFQAPAWSPDGTNLAYSDSTRGGAAIKVAASDGSVEGKLVGYRSTNLFPAWSPDGSSIAFSSDRDGDFDVYVISTNGSGLQRVSDTAEDELHPQWSPDSTQLVFERRSATGSELFSAQSDGSDESQLTDGAEDRFPSVSPDGGAIVFTRDSDVYRVGTDGDGEQRVSSDVHVGGAAVWSPDSQRVAFSASGDVYTVAADGSELFRVTNTDERESAPDWQTVFGSTGGGTTVSIAAAGDIACDPEDRGYNGGEGTEDRCHMRATSDLLVAGNYAAVLTLGDNQYPRGAFEDFMESYDPTWGRVKDITYPSAGNHEYGSAGPGGYFDYFGERAGDPDRGYYSFDLGEWHLVALNSNCEFVGGCDEGSEQVEWLEADLAAHPSRCTLAFWHHPRFSSGHDGDATYMEAIWDELYEAGAELALVGHSHNYERFAPMDDRGRVDHSDGIREFVVGTGGAFFTGGLQDSPNSEIWHNKTFGVLELTLKPDSYDWRFVPEEGETFTDSGSGRCH